MESIAGASRVELRRLCESWNISSLHVNRLLHYVWRDGVTSSHEMTDLPLRLQDLLAELFDFTPPRVIAQSISDDHRSVKLLVRLFDGAQIETVVMLYPGRATLCVSSQAGCPLGCVFCATGQAGFTRNLTCAEIAWQYLLARRCLNESEQFATEEIRNVVVMGMGEPLLNTESVFAALELFTDRSGPSLAAKRITISTVGIVPGIVKMAEERQPYSLAVSLHSVDQSRRERLLPIAKTWTLNALREACRFYSTTLQRRIFYEWTIIAGENDSCDEAARLADWLRDIPAHVNLIPLNATADFSGFSAAAQTIESFQAVLRARGVPSTVRRRHGIEIAGGCGQLAAVK